MDVLITLTTAGADTGPFNLYSNVDSYTTAFETGVAKSALVAGYLSTLVPASTNYIRVKSTGRCTNYIDIFVTGSATTTTTTTSGPGTTTTTTTQVVTYYNVVLCGTSTPSVIRHNGPNNVTLGVVVQSSNGSCYTVSSVGSGPETVGTLLTQFASCVLCQGAPPPTTTTTTTASPTTTTTTTNVFVSCQEWRNDTLEEATVTYTPCNTVTPVSNYALATTSSICAVFGSITVTVGGPLTLVGSCNTPAPTTTTTTTATPTTTTTTTTSAPITYEYYFASEYLCGNCDTPTATDVLVKFVTGTVVIPNRFYKEINPTNYVYQITDTSQGIGIAYTLITPTYNTCEDACNLPAPTTTTTTAPPATTTTTTTGGINHPYQFPITVGWGNQPSACNDASTNISVWGDFPQFIDNNTYYYTQISNIPYDGSNLYYRNTNGSQYVQISSTGQRLDQGNC